MPYFYYDLNGETRQIEADSYTQQRESKVKLEVDSTPDCYQAVSVPFVIDIPDYVTTLAVIDIGIAGGGNACLSPAPFAGIKRGYRLTGNGWTSEILGAELGVANVRILEIGVCSTTFYKDNIALITVATCDISEDIRNPCCCSELLSIARGISI